MVISPNPTQNQDSDHLQQRTISFLDFPPPVRRDIYILSSLVRFCPISLNTAGADQAEFLAECMEYCSDGFAKDANSYANSRCFYRQKRFWNNCVVASPEGFDCICMPVPIALLRISKAVYREVSSILYTENKFRISRSDRRGLSPLFALNSFALQSLRSLSIRLNACSCIPGHRCSKEEPLINGFLKACPECHGTCKIGRDSPATIHDSTGRALLSDWNKLLSLLKMHLSPASLRLSVVCDTLDYATAQKFADISIQLPQLAECSIRLGQAPDSALQRLAEDTVHRLTDHSTYNLKPFRFNSLPEEIQRQILMHTDLISPAKIARLDGGGLSGSNDCCQRCTDALEACFCSVRHAAYSSMPCHCWVFPAALFLVSRKMTRYAMEIFFSQNTFVAYPGDASPDLPDSIHHLRLLQQLPPAALQYLRHLRFEFSNLNHPCLDPGTDFQKHWALTIDFISRNLVLSQLTIRIIDETGRDATEAWYTTGLNDSAELEAEDWELYQRLAEPLQNLKGIKDLWIHLKGPVHGTYYGDEWVQLRRQREVILERRIMGHEYNSAPRGKFMERDRLRAKHYEMRREIVPGPDNTIVWPPSERRCLPFNEDRF